MVAPEAVDAAILAVVTNPEMNFRRRRETTPINMEGHKAKINSRTLEEPKKTPTLRHPEAAEEVVAMSGCGAVASAMEKGAECQ